MHYLYRRYHSSSTNTHEIKSDAGLSWAVQFRLLCSSTSSCSKSNRRNGSNKSRWRISIPVILPLGRPLKLHAAPESIRLLEALIVVVFRSWSKMDLAIEQRGTTVSCRPQNNLPSSSFRHPYTRSRRFFNFTAAVPTILSRTSTSAIYKHVLIAPLLHVKINYYILLHIFTIVITNYYSVSTVFLRIFTMVITSLLRVITIVITWLLPVITVKMTYYYPLLP